LAIFQ